MNLKHLRIENYTQYSATEIYYSCITFVQYNVCFYVFHLQSNLNKTNIKYYNHINHQNTIIQFFFNNIHRDGYRLKIFDTDTDKRVLFSLD